MADEPPPVQQTLVKLLGEMTLAATKLTKNYRHWMLDQMRDNLAIALASASRFATLPPPDPHALDDKISAAEATAPDVSASTRVAANFCDKVFRLAATNLKVTMEFARRLDGVTSPSELVQLSTSHLRRHAECIITQATAFGTLPQDLAASSAEQLDKALSKKPVPGSQS